MTCEKRGRITEKEDWKRIGVLILALMTGAFSSSAAPSQVPAWAIPMFPAAPKLEIYVDELPIRDASSHIGEEELEAMKLENVTELVVQRRDYPVDTSFICDNLRLFPNLRVLDLSHIPTMIFPKKEKETNPVSSCIEILKFHADTLASHEFLRGIARTFPSLVELYIKMDLFEKMKCWKQMTPDGSSEENSLSLISSTLKTLKRGIRSIFSLETLQGGPLKQIIFNDKMDTTSFKALRILSISVSLYASPREVILDESMADLFPSLEEMTISGFSSIELNLSSSAGSTKRLAKLNRLTIRYGIAKRSLSSFEKLFPNLEALAITECEISEVFDANEKQEFEHSCLKRLSIKKNRHPLPSAGRFKFPKLDFLDMRSCLQQKIPSDFFDGCSNVKELMLPFDIPHGHKTVEWWDCLKALPTLEKVHVEMAPYAESYYATYHLQPKQGFEGEILAEIAEELLYTLSKARESWKSFPEIGLFTPGRDEPIDIARYPECVLIGPDDYSQEEIERKPAILPSRQTAEAEVPQGSNEDSSHDDMDMDEAGLPFEFY